MSKLTGFSSDLLILQLNSEAASHDGVSASFYEKLKCGQPYEGFYAVPWREIREIFRGLKQGQFAPKVEPASQ
jgi:hypothetical protein